MFIGYFSKIYEKQQENHAQPYIILNN
jgi:hypothetical protein